MARRALPLILRAYAPGDEHAFVPREDLAEEMRASAWDWRAGPPPGRVFTLTDWRSGAVHGLGGLVQRGDGWWEAWACLGQLNRRDWPQAAWLAARELGALKRCANHTVSRITASARVDRPAAVALLRRIGFVPGPVIEDPRLAGVRLQTLDWRG